MANVVKVVSQQNSIPKLVTNARYQVFVRGGKEYILDWYEGYFPIAEAHKCGLVLEKTDG